MFRKTRAEIVKLKDENKKMAGKLSQIGFCEECGEVYRRRYKITWYGATATHTEISHHPVTSYGLTDCIEIKNCSACDAIVEQREKARAIAERCPDEVVKLGNRKACKE